MNRGPMARNEDHLFHRSQQFEAVIAAHEAREQASFEQMRRSLEAAWSEEIPPPPLHEEVTLQLNMHGNELRYFAGHVRELGTNVGLELAQLHAQTGCVLSIADVGDRDAFNHLRVVGKIDRVLDAMDRFVSFIPYHCGIHLNRERAFMSGAQYREHCKQLLEQVHAADRPNVVVHFATEETKDEDTNPEKWAVFCAKRADAHALKTVASGFAQRIAPKDGPHPLHSFFIAYVLPGQEKPWFLSGPEHQQLLKEISRRTSTIIRHPRDAHESKDLNLHVLGTPQALIEVQDMMQSVAQITLQFDVEDAKLQKPFGHPVIITNAVDDVHLVLMSVEPSRFQVHAPAYSNRIWHRISLKTSYRNRQALFVKRRSMLRPEGERTILPLNEIGNRPSKLPFADFLLNVLHSMQRPPAPPPPPPHAQQRGFHGAPHRRQWAR